MKHAAQSCMSNSMMRWCFSVKLGDGFRILPPAMHRIAKILIGLLGVYILLYIVNVFFYLGVPIFGEHKVIVYGMILLLIFFTIPMSQRDAERLPWYDVLFMIGSVASAVYLLTQWQNILYGRPVPSFSLQLFGGILLIATLEAARRTLGLAFAAIGLAFIFYPLFGSYFPGFLFTKQYEFKRLAEVFYASENGIFGSSMALFATIVVMFFIFGSFINSSKASNLLLDIGSAIAGGSRGGPAKIAVFSSALFSSISGVGAANVAATGTFTIPLMRSYGFKGTQAAAIEAAASSGGVLVPPIMGAAAFLMADFLSIPFWNVIVAALLPSFFYYIALFFMVDAMAAKDGLGAIPKSERPKLLATIKEYGYFFLPVLVLIVSLGYFKHSAQLSAFYATLSIIAVSFFKRNTRITLVQIIDALLDGITGFLKLAPAAAIVGIIIASVDMTGLSLTLASGLRDLAGGNLFMLLLLIAMASIIMGMGSSPLLVYLILVILLVPAMVDLGVAPIAAHFFIFYFSVAALLTPPVALSVIMAAGIAKVPFWPSAWEAVRLSIVVFIIPFVFAFDPSLLMQGSWPEIAYVFVKTLAAVFALTCGLGGYFIVCSVNIWERLLLIAGGFCLIYMNVWTDLAGFALLLIASALILMNKNRRMMTSVSQS